MARGINKVTLIGHVGELDTRYTKAGLAICSFSLATGKEWKNKETGEKEERTEWHQCVAFEPISNILHEYVSKGYRIYVAGELSTQKWVDQQNVTRYTTRIIVGEMEIMSAPKNSAPTPATTLDHTTDYGIDPDIDEAHQYEEMRG